MKRGFKALAVLAASALAIAGPQAFAVCGEFGGFAVFQCANLAYFEAPPAGAGAVDAVFWQIKFGNGEINTGQSSTGTGMTGLSTFNGNDSGNFAVDLVDMASIIPGAPAGALCLRSNNWGNTAVDGCCDNPRSTTQPFADDDILNPEYDVYYSRGFGYPGYPSLDWRQDYPMAVLLRESSGHYFAAAAVASMVRTGVNDVRPGFFDFTDVSDGNANALTAANNAVPWQKIPGDRQPGDPAFVVNVTELVSNDRQVDLQWTGAVIHSDQSVRPSTNSTITNPGHGVGVNDMGGLVRYVVESQPIQDASDPIGTLLPGNWTAIHSTAGTSATVVVPPDTCLRLHTYLGADPQTNTHTIPACRVGNCGDLGYDVAGGPACVGGPLVADGLPQALEAVRGKGDVKVTWRTSSELSVQRFDVFAVKDGRTKVGEAACTACTDGRGGAYTVTVRAGDLKGARTIEVVAVGPNAKASTRIK